MKTLETRLYVDESIITIPASVVDFKSFRDWTLSDDFPKCGRIDFIAGNIEVDMCPANIQRHSGPKTDVGWFIGDIVRARNLGRVYIDQTRVVTKDPELSCEPDIVFVSWKRINTGELIFRPSKHPRDNYDQMEIDGGPDLIVEVLSPSSVVKDTQQLKGAYFRAGVLEYWIVDAMGKTPQLTVFRPGKSGYKAAVPDRDGFQKSAVLNVGVKLVCETGLAANMLVYTLLTK